MLIGTCANIVAILTIIDADNSMLAMSTLALTTPYAVSVDGNTMAISLVLMLFMTILSSTVSILKSPNNSAFHDFPIFIHRFELN